MTSFNMGFVVNYRPFAAHMFIGSLFEFEEGPLLDIILPRGFVPTNQSCGFNTKLLKLSAKQFGGPNNNQRLSVGFPVKAISNRSPTDLFFAAPSRRSCFPCLHRPFLPQEGSSLLTGFLGGERGWEFFTPGALSICSERSIALQELAPFCHKLWLVS